MGDTIPEFHPFRAMCEHIAKGGAAYRWGSAYPIYYGATYGIEKRTWGGSGGEMVTMAFPGSAADFTADEQNSTNWVLIPKADWQDREDKMRAEYRKIEKQESERRAQQTRAKASNKRRWMSWLTGASNA